MSFKDKSVEELKNTIDSARLEIDRRVSIQDAVTKLHEAMQSAWSRNVERSDAKKVFDEVFGSAGRI